MFGEKNTNLIQDLTEGSVVKTLLAFSFPLMGANLLQTCYNLVDMIFIGRVVGRAGLSAVSIGGDVLHFLMFLAMGLSGAGQVILARYVGENDREKIKQAIGTMFTVILGAGLLCSILCLFGLDFLIKLMNTPEEALTYAREYCLTCIIGLVFIYGYNMVSAILRGMGDSKHPFIFVFLATAVNIALDAVFVLGFRWGPFGAALATVIGQGVSFLWALYFLFHHKEEFCFDFRLESFKPDGQMLSALIRLGIPMCLQSAAISISLIFVNSYINMYGVIASAVTGIGNKLGSIAAIVTNALSVAGSSMVSQSLGARKNERVFHVLLTNLLISLAFAGLLSFLTIAFPDMVFGIFNKEPEVLEMARDYIPVAVLLYGGCAMRAPAFALINGSGNGKLNLAVAILDGVISRIGLAILLGIYMQLGIMGFWLGHALAGFVPGIISFAYYIFGKWKT